MATDGTTRAVEWVTAIGGLAGVAVALAKGGTCQGCRMRLPPQLYNEIQKHLQIHFCPNCQRILYYEGPAAPAA